MARLLISRLSPSVSDRLRKTLPEEQHFDGIAVWNHLQITYGISKLASNAATNVEKLILDLLTLQWNKSTPFSKHLRTVRAKLVVILANKRIAGSTTARNIVTSLLLRDLLDRMSDQARYRVVHERFFEEMVGKDVQLTESAFEELYAAVEKVDCAHASSQGSQQQQRAGFKPRREASAGTAAASPSHRAQQQPQRPKDVRRPGVSATGGKPSVHTLQSKDDDIRSVNELTEQLNIDAYLSVRYIRQFHISRGVDPPFW